MGEISSATLWAQAPALGASLASVALVFHLPAGWAAERAAAMAAGGVLAPAPMALPYATQVNPYTPASDTYPWVQENEYIPGRRISPKAS